jgi:hypothetical protein
MLWVYGIIVILVAILLIPNALYAFRKFLQDRNMLLLIIYFVFLILLAYLLLHVTTRMTELVQTAKEVYEEPGP